LLVTEWKFVQDDARVPDTADFNDGTKRVGPPASSSHHIDVDRLVFVLIHGNDITPDLYGHLLKCMRCRYVMVAAVCDELQRWRHTRLCHTRESLFNEWRDAAEMYTKNMAELTGKVDQVSQAELLTLAKVVEIARKLTANIRSELDEHIAIHRC